jgi:hypothetical protein
MDLLYIGNGRVKDASHGGGNFRAYAIVWNRGYSYAVIGMRIKNLSKIRRYLPIGHGLLLHLLLQAALNPLLCLQSID